MESSNRLVVNQLQKGSARGYYTLEEPDTHVTVKDLPSDVYRVIIHTGLFMPTKLFYAPLVAKETYVEFTTGTVGRVLARAKNFFSQSVKEKYAHLGITHKTAFMLYGKPGTGKTVTAQIIMKEMCRLYNAYALVFDSDTPPQHVVKAVHEIAQFGKPIVVFIDECENTFNKYEDDWLTFLDGHLSASNIMLLCCTNYPKRLSPRMLRPSRIEHHIPVRLMEETVARQYLESKLPSLKKDVMHGVIHYTMEAEATIDVFKNSIKEFYLHTNCDSPEAFKEILEAYMKEGFDEEEKSNSDF